MKIIFNAILSLSALALITGCGEQKPAENAESAATAATPVYFSGTVNYNADTANLVGFVAYDSANTTKRPIVVVVPEWWGVDDYPKARAKQLAELGYFAIVADIYGNGKLAADPKEANALSGQFYANPALAKSRVEAAIAKAATYVQADTANVAAIGYCFGGAVVLNSAKLGANLDAVVSFHGGLEGVAPDKSLLKAKVLVCHGNADGFVPPAQMAAFRKQMDSVSADYKVIAYDSAKHAFTNPKATETGKKFNIPIAYNEAADKKSWEDMKAFLSDTFKN